MIDLTKKTEKAIAITTLRKGGDREAAQENLNELSLLAETSGAEVIEQFWQEMDKPNRKTHIGSGKVLEIKEFIDEEGINIVIFDHELTPMQVRNLEESFDVKVLDRSSIILDIFASRAQTTEAKTQVELAQYQHLLPRLTRMWTHLSKQFGGIGTKGPGETQIETDRRIIRNKIEYLKKKLIGIEKQHEQKLKSHGDLPRFGLVGYTNAGKSTIMKLITKSDVYVENQLFATLDTTVRRFELLNGKTALLSDTVGFIRKLPTKLIASFRSTLSEAREADYLLHVVDISNEFFRDHIEVVNKTLESLNIKLDNTILVFNKIDQLDDQDEFSLIQEQFPDSIFISAKTQKNFDKLMNLIQEKYDKLAKKYELFIPYKDSRLINGIYELGEITDRIDDDFGHHLDVKVKEEYTQKFEHTYHNYFASALNSK